MVVFLLQYFTFYIVFKPPQIINKIGGSVGTVLLEFCMQPQYRLQYEHNFFILLSFDIYNIYCGRKSIYIRLILSGHFAPSQL